MKKWVLLALLVACGDDGPPPGVSPDTSVTPRDTGVDTGVADGGAEDARADGSADAGVDGAADTGADTSLPDFALPDAGPPDPVRVCPDDAPDSTCGAGCAAGFVCVDAFCGGQECVPGRPCDANEQCSGDCLFPDGPGTDGICEVAGGACSESGDCPLGFACEGATCVDRRIPCAFHPNNCPRGYTCTFAPVEGLAFCVPAFVPCTSAGTCELGSSCADADGDGDRECVPSGLCASNDDCEGGTSCAADPGPSASICAPDGLCRDGACPAGFECRDTGTGVARCVASGGSCTQDSECAPQSICGAIEPDDPLRCLTFDEEL